MQKFSLVNGKANFFFLALLLFAISLPLSEFMVSVSSGILLITAWTEGRWIDKIQNIKDRKILLLIPAIYIIYLLGAIITRNGETVLYDLRKALFFIVIPLAFLVGKKITSDQKQKVLFVFVVSVTIAVIYAVFNWLFSRSENIHIHNASLITHIRFSFQLILAFWILFFTGVKNFGINGQMKNATLFLFLIIILGFLLIQQSLTGLTALVISVLFYLVIKVFNLKTKFRYTLIGIIAVLILLPSVYIFLIGYKFYFPEKYDLNKLPKTTAKGNHYKHNIENKLIENGRFVYLFVCEKEMREEWNKRSKLKYDSLDQYGYSIKSTLVRYLTSKGLTKDASGVKALNEKDIKNVQNGISNYLFTEKRWSLFPRVYKTVWEFYVYTKLDYVNNQSFSQRIEFAKAAISIVKEHPWFGVGPGNWKQAFFDAYKKMNSNLKEEFYASSHNQYLNYLVKFGIVGFFLIMFFLIYPVIKTRRYKDQLFLLFLVFMFVANFADSNFESHMGSSFFVFFYCFFLATDGLNYLLIKK